MAHPCSLPKDSKPRSKRRDFRNVRQNMRSLREQSKVCRITFCSAHVHQVNHRRQVDTKQNCGILLLCTDARKTIPYIRSASASLFVRPDVVASLKLRKVISRRRNCPWTPSQHNLATEIAHFVSDPSLGRDLALAVRPLRFGGSR